MRQSHFHSFGWYTPYFVLKIDFTSFHHSEFSSPYKSESHQLKYSFDHWITMVTIHAFKKRRELRNIQSSHTLNFTGLQSFVKVRGWIILNQSFTNCKTENTPSVLPSGHLTTPLEAFMY